MKKLTKLLGIVLIIALVMSISVSAFAASITINSGSTSSTATSETTSYTYYQIFNASIGTSGTVNAATGELTTAGTVSYSIPAANADLATAVNALTVGGVDLFTVTLSADSTSYSVVLNKKSETESFTGAEIAEALNVTAITSKALATGTFAQSTPGGTATKSELAAGYYLILSSLGTKLAVQTLDAVTINEKNEYHTTAKSASKTNMNVGDIVTYTITVHVPESAKVDDVITVHDTLDSHLQADLNTLAAKYVTPAVAPATEPTETSVTLGDGTKKAETETFAKTITVTEGMLGKDIVITYNAELLSTAADDTGYVNEVFSNTSTYETKPVDVKVWTFDFDLDKEFQGVTSDDAANYSATFELYSSTEYSTTTREYFKDEGKTTPADEGETTEFYTESTSSNAILFITDATGYVKADSNDTGASATLTVNGKDNINVRGLKEGTYYLVEKTTSAGYNLLTDPIIVTITDTTTGTQPDVTVSHSVSYKVGESGTASSGTVTVQNNSGTTLPSTGGIGTTIFYIVGSVLVIAAGVLLVTKKRMGRD